ncbi:hypothetical protein HD806DRAFT_545428 [Xylariaceae sp. AK1471]|nr:hypothetical protein HD806DRAFT_545428 [Xylariaceae sp. AK1471]
MSHLCSTTGSPTSGLTAPQSPVPSNTMDIKLSREIDGIPPERVIYHYLRGLGVQLVCVEELPESERPPSYKDLDDLITRDLLDPEATERVNSDSRFELVLALATIIIRTKHQLHKQQTLETASMHHNEEGQPESIQRDTEGEGMAGDVTMLTIPWHGPLVSSFPYIEGYYNTAQEFFQIARRLRYKDFIKIHAPELVAIEAVLLETILAEVNDRFIITLGSDDQGFNKAITYLLTIATSAEIILYLKNI